MSFLGKIKKKIFFFIEMINEFCRFQREKRCISSNCYVLISHNAHGAGGAPVVLYELAKLIKKNGSDVVFLSYGPGDLLDYCRENGIYGYMTGKLQNQYLKELITHSPCCFVVNTMPCHKSVRFLLENDIDARIFWWVHEENKIIQENAKTLLVVPNARFRLLCVSERVKTTVELCMPQFKNHVSVMYYGCEDLLQRYGIVQNKKKVEDKYIICSIGYISSRKNQLQLVDAVEQLPKEMRDKLEVHFVYASVDKTYFQKLQAAVEGKPYYKMIGAIPRNQMVEIYQNMDLLVCSSVDDPLPVVVTEAMMLKKPFITSSETGQYALVDNGVNGYTYNIANTRELTHCIMTAYENRINDVIVCRARELFESQFSLETLDKKFQELFN